jgi:hypothetical protein
MFQKLTAPRIEPPDIRDSEGLAGRYKRISELVAKGYDDVDSTFGYHGTSIQALERLLIDGNLPPGGRGGTSAGSLYFFPRTTGSTGSDIWEAFPGAEPNAIGGGTAYANNIAQRDYFLTCLGLDLGTLENWRAADAVLFWPEHIRDFESDERTKVLSKAGFKENEIFRLAKNAREEAKGVVLCLRKALLEEHQVYEGDPGEGDFYLQLPDGLPIEYLSGIEPLGQLEFNYLASIQEMVSEHYK